MQLRSMLAPYGAIVETELGPNPYQKPICNAFWATPERIPVNNVNSRGNDSLGGNPPRQKLAAGRGEL